MFIHRAQYFSSSSSIRHADVKHTLWYTHSHTYSIRAAYQLGLLYSIQSPSTPLVWLNSLRCVRSVAIRRWYNVVHRRAVLSSRLIFGVWVWPFIRLFVCYHRFFFVLASIDSRIRTVNDGGRNHHEANFPVKQKKWIVSEFKISTKQIFV